VSFMSPSNAVPLTLVVHGDELAERRFASVSLDCLIEDFPSVRRVNRRGRATSARPNVRAMRPKKTLCAWMNLEA